MSDIIEQMELVNVPELDTKQAKEWLEKLVWYYMSGEYRAEGDTRRSGYSLSPGEAADKIRAEFPGLVEQAGYSAFSRTTVDRTYQRVLDKKWASRRGIAADLVQKNLRRLEKGMELVTKILDSEEVDKEGRVRVKLDTKLNAIDRLVALEKRQAQISGYDAPSRVEILAGNSQDAVFTEQEKQQVVRELREWEEQQFALPDGKIEIVEGETSP